jgi:hypothetical protein
MFSHLLKNRTKLCPTLDLLATFDFLYKRLYILLMDPVIFVYTCSKHRFLFYCVFSFMACILIKRDLIFNLQLKF